MSEAGAPGGFGGGGFGGGAGGPRAAGGGVFWAAARAARGVSSIAVDAGGMTASRAAR
jgi:hypothetical protein